ncbi:DNA cytosine methyltransferase [Anaerosalibacter massiliensis]|uniref:DNA (cytosine-5-)-methyltransferase n=1 Tax=Anaerosalibacter massiliensis TaxID=1347392 RepID=A0A9X2ML39_9FIRM|nr:DNA cytosine methyltransferase [Anaerosalibacter massiliensis]MCR2045503.1 DNA cytosine methyltransferase [Anaerosalibacter massiliensis]
MLVLSLFSGIGAFEKALKKAGVNYKIVNYCEIDKYASHAYSAIHDISESYNLQDVTKIDTDQLKDFDLLTHGSPCQDFSLSGKGKGGDEGRLNTKQISKYGLLKVGDIKNPNRFKMNNRVFSKDGVSPTLTTTNPTKIVECKVRHLTPLEFWRATGFSDEDYWKAKRALEQEFYKGKDRTDSQMYKMAGNSIVVNVLEDIYRELFID